MNPGVVALDRLVAMGLFEKGSLPTTPDSLQYFPAWRKPAGPRDWANAAGLVHVASKWTGTRGLSVVRGRNAEDVVYLYNPKEDR